MTEMPYSMCVPESAITALNGTWTIERQLSSWSNGLFPRDSMDLTVSLRLEDGHLFYHSVNRTDPAVAPSHFRFDIPLDDRPYPFTGSRRFDHLRGRLLPDGSLEVLKLRGGAIVIAEIWRRDREGLLFRWGVSCVVPQEPKAYTEYFSALDEKGAGRHACSL